MTSYLYYLTTMTLLTLSIASTLNTQETNTQYGDAVKPSFKLRRVLGLPRDRRFVLDDFANATGWSDWTNSSQCSTTCGDGVLKQTRTCLSHTEHCTGPEVNFIRCNVQPCAASAEWMPWGSFTPCSAQCGQFGTRHRVRECNTGNRQDCEHVSYYTHYEVEACRGGSCEEPVWSDWSSWSPCSLTCGNGVCWRTRHCYHGKITDCIGNNTDITSCYVTSCKKDNDWSEWENATQCTSSCGKGTYSQSRKCISGNDTQCTGNATRILPCVLPECPVGVTMDGSWSTWEEWNQCSVSCGTGVQHRTRTCTDPAPSQNGANCTGDSTSFQLCRNNCTNTQSLGVTLDGSWSVWEEWNQCSVSCGTGVQHRTRTCTDPAPSQNGANCTGDNTSFQLCRNNCTDILVQSLGKTLDGSWSTWQEWNQCSVSCGTGVQHRTRTCTDPAPSQHGANCTGDSTSFQLCRNNCTDTQSLGVTLDGSWSTWEEWNQCSVSCGTGVQHRTRTCTDPAPTQNGANCTGDSTSFQLCRNNCTDTQSRWSAWENTTQCSSSCGKGTYSQSRKCSSGNDTQCTGNATRILPCALPECPVWSEWENTTQCSSSCGNGSFSQSRKCSSGNDTQCTGNATRILPCVLPECPDWSEWENTTQCSSSCGNGSFSQSRKCSSGNDTQCTGNATRILPCVLPECTGSSWSLWSAWTSCSRSCGHGERTRSRDCSHPTPPGGDIGCIGDRAKTEACTEMAVCPEWSQWFTMECSVTCGEGVQHRLRHCSSGHDLDCPGVAMDTAVCNTRSC